MSFENPYRSPATEPLAEADARRPDVTWLTWLASFVALVISLLNLVPVRALLRIASQREAGPFEELWVPRLWGLLAVDGLLVVAIAGGAWCTLGRRSFGPRVFGATCALGMAIQAVNALVFGKLFAEDLATKQPDEIGQMVRILCVWSLLTMVGLFAAWMHLRRLGPKS